jgi:iron-sulfur cluster assembly protein
MIQLTNKASDHIKSLMNREGKSELGLRVGVKGGGCSGLSYYMGFQDKARQDDTVYELNGIKIFLDEQSEAYLSGTELDYTDDLNGAGFVFKNPNAKRTCSCGDSFCA